MLVTVTDADGETVISETVEVPPGTDRSSGIELETTVSVDRSYTFEAAFPAGEGVSTETAVKCGNVFVFVTESGELGIRDDSHEGD